MELTLGSRWHQDIRPENILIHSQGSTAPHEFRFMLGDLGLSHFVRMSRSDDDPTAIDTMGTRTYGKRSSHIFIRGTNAFKGHRKFTGTLTFLKQGAYLPHERSISGPWAVSC